MSEVENGPQEATITSIQVNQVMRARAHLAESVRSMTIAETFIAQSSEHVLAAMRLWDTAGEVDSDDRVQLDERDYCIETMRDHVRDMILRYAPLAYGRTEGDNKDLADGHRWGRG